MALLGVLLVIAAVIAGVLLFIGTGSLSTPIQVDVLGGTVEFPPIVLLITGMVVISVFWFGWFLLRVGVKRGHRRRQEAKEAERLAAEQRLADEQRMKDEVAVRERQLEEERRRHEEREAELRQEAEERVKEQHTATETARRRAEVAEAEATKETSDAKVAKDAKGAKDAPTSSGDDAATPPAKA
ncbi:hypothetical protein JQN72_10110 [Phycicoccus sp. CSK15P-2]|uniref:hypothetical protein n=1 Tax=Phycicoccus sp. CSK15P-2 TaxID=2807627 RepID=UPI0019505BEA|nr:hypothetical protein [Phycicoccus sp. CSK15P-2]MBM6404593.1 hypothetical protein [Phycicoccus sp. CSK15P-2]